MATILIAGIFAFTPMQKVTAVHQFIIDAILGGDFTLSEIFDILSSNHIDLSSNHFDLSANHKDLSANHKDLSGALKERFQTISGHTSDISGDHHDLRKLIKDKVTNLRNDRK